MVVIAFASSVSGIQHESAGASEQLSRQFSHLAKNELKLDAIQDTFDADQSTHRGSRMDGGPMLKVAELADRMAEKLERYGDVLKKNRIAAEN